jgi:heme A synthase
MRWIVIPPLVASVLLIEVSFFGATVVLRGITPGWAAVDLGSALLVAALMVTAAVIADARKFHTALSDRITFRDPLARLVLATVAVVYGVLVSGVLVAGQNSITSCLGWPIYSSVVYQMDSHGPGNISRLIVSGVGLLLIATMLVQVWRSRRGRPAVYRAARWVLATFLLESLVQVLLLAFGFEVFLLVAYTVTVSLFWGLLVALGVRASLESA